MKTMAIYCYNIAGLLFLVNAAIWALTKNADRKHNAAMRMLACGIGVVIFGGLYCLSFLSL